MKIFTLLCLFFPLIFGSPNDEFVEDKLIQLYIDSKGLYLRNPEIAYDNSLFAKSYRQIRKILKNQLAKDPKSLFNTLLRHANRQIAHYFFGEIVSILLPDLEDDIWGEDDIWEEHLHSNSLVCFFERSKKLMRTVCRYDKKIVNDILPIVLSIQRQHINHLKGNEERIKVAERIRKFEFISHSFDPGNTRTLLKLYEELRLLALKYNGQIPKTGKDRLAISRSLKLLKLYCRQFYDHHWVELDEYRFTAIPQELLFLILIEFSSPRLLFSYLSDTSIGRVDDLFYFNDDFSDIMEILGVDSRSCRYKILTFVLPKKYSL
jgi:hypothetical protein